MIGFAATARARERRVEIGALRILFDDAAVLVQIRKAIACRLRDFVRTIVGRDRARARDVVVAERGRLVLLDAAPLFVAPPERRARLRLAVVAADAIEIEAARVRRI